MIKTDLAFVCLAAHPNTPNEAVRRVAATVELIGSDALRFAYVLEMAPGLVRIPAPIGGAGRADRLWTHTCFEAFVALAQSPRYLELNFSPSGQWAAYSFESYRQGMAPALDIAPRLELGGDAARLELQAEVPVSRLLGSWASRNDTLRLALSTVVEDQEGGLSYWALRHPAGRPDFHHSDGFSLTLELPRDPAQ